MHNNRTGCCHKITLLLWENIGKNVDFLFICCCSIYVCFVGVFCCCLGVFCCFFVWLGFFWCGFFLFVCLVLLVGVLCLLLYLFLVFVWLDFFPHREEYDSYDKRGSLKSSLPTTIQVTSPKDLLAQSFTTLTISVGFFLSLHLCNHFMDPV